VLGTGTDPVIRIINPTRVQITADVLVQDLGQIVNGQSATITPMGEGPMAGTVTRVTTPSSPDAGTAAVALTLAPGIPSPPAGTAVLVEILIASVPEALVVPTAAVQRVSGVTFVMVAGTDNRVMRRDVRVGLTTPQLTQILDGLTVGEFIITSALTEINEGDLVSFSRGVLAMGQ